LVLSADHRRSAGDVRVRGVVWKSLRTAAIVLTAAGCIRTIQIGAFGGNEMVVGLLPIETFATAMCFVWWTTSRRRSLRKTPFNAALFLLLPASLVSLIVGFVDYDPNIALDHMKLSVSIGQVVLTMWPVATYLVIANTVDDLDTIEAIRKTIVVLALPSVLLIVSPWLWPYVEWSTSFALPASSFCFVEFCGTSSKLRKLGLLAVVVAPAIYGVYMGKAFYYAYVIVSTGTIGMFRLRRVMIATVPVAVAAYVLAVPLWSNSLTPKFIDGLVEHEEQEQSLGGEGGRDRLIQDGLGIWSRAPVLGVGPGNNYPYMLQYSTLGTAHNQYVNILIETGAVGLLLFIAFIAQAWRMGLTLWRRARSPVVRNLVLAWFGVFAGFVVGGFFGDFMLPSIRNSGLDLFAQFYVQWIVLGLVVSAAAIERRHTAGMAARRRGAGVKTYEYA